MMRVFGLDFTAAPGVANPITCAACSLDGDRLWLDGLASFHEFELFENFLRRDGPWIAGIDFPFGQPRRLVRALGWPRRWSEYVALVGRLSSHEFEAALERCRLARESDREADLRETDRLAGANGSMVPLGRSRARMFHQGAPRLLASEVSVVPCRPTAAEQIVLEASPALAARVLEAESERHADTRSRTASTGNASLVHGLVGECLGPEYALRIEIPGVMMEDLAADSGRRLLDAVLCAVQAGWAWRHRGHGYGIPRHVDSNEGWIVDPATAVELAGQSR